MQDYHDIYKKDETPFMARRRRRSARSHRQRASSTERLHSIGDDTIAFSAEARERHTHHPHRRFRRSTNTSMAGWLLTLVLAGTALAYLAVLTATHLRKPTAPAPVPAAESSAHPAATPDHAVVALQTTRQINQLIFQWAKLPELIDEVRRRSDRSQSDWAIRKLREALEKNPETAALHYELAKLYAEGRQYAAAVEHLLKTLGSIPTHEPARILLAGVLATQDNYDAALSVLDWILKTGGEAARAHEIAALVYLKTRRPGQALSHLRKLEALGFSSPAMRNNLAIALLHSNEPAKAAQIFEELKPALESQPLLHCHLAQAYAAQNKADDAVRVLNTARERFGPYLVSDWLKTPAFDGVRAAPVFMGLSQSLGITNQVTSAENAAPMPSEFELEPMLAPELLVLPTAD